MYVIDTNVIISALIKGELVRKCLETCHSQYLIIEPVLDEFIDKIGEVINKTKRRIETGKYALEDVLYRIDILTSL